MTRPKTNPGNFFEDFRLGQVIHHATPRTLTTGDAALYQALYGSRFMVQSSHDAQQGLHYDTSATGTHNLLDDLLVFHTVFGKTVPDISLNAVANLGYAECRFLRPVLTGATLKADSEVIGLRENANRESGVVYVRTRGTVVGDEAAGPVLEYVRWVMVRKRDKASPAPETVIPKLAERVDPASIGSALPAPSRLLARRYDVARSGSPHIWGDYAVGERIDHVDGQTVEEAEHQLATRLYQNTAKVHFDAHAAKGTRFGRRLIYGGVVISIARALSFNGLANAFHVAAINGGRHVAPLFAGDTVYAWSEILETAELHDRKDYGTLRVRTVAAKDRPCGDFPLKTERGDYADGVILDLDYWVVMPR